MRTARRRRVAGSVMVELTLSMVFLTPLFCGAAAFGYTFYVYSKLLNAVRSGSRYASTQMYNSASSTPTSSFVTAVQKMTVYGDPAADPASATAVVSGLTTSQVRLTVAFNNGAPTGMTVAINGYQLPVYLGSLALNNKPYAWFPFTGKFGPP